MEEVIFPHPAIVAQLTRMVRVRLYTDDLDNPARTERNQKMQEARFNTVALPFYAILSPEDKVLATFPGFTKDVEEFLGFLKTGLAGNEKR